jgi:serine protease
LLAAAALCATTATINVIAAQPIMDSPQPINSVFSLNINTTFSAAAAPVAPAAKPLFTLVVLRDETIPSAIVPANGKALADLANSNTDNARRLIAALGTPSQVRVLIVERPNDDYLAALKPGSTEHRLLNYVMLQYPDAKAASAANESLLAQRIFRSVQADISDQFSAAPNDPYFAPAQTSPLNKQWGMTALNLPAAWNTQTGYAYIGVVDNGIQRNHPDLGEDRAGNVRAHFSGRWTTSSPIPTAAGFSESDDQFALGHGSHVAGIIGATSNNSTGVSGVCQNCSLAIAKISSSTGISQSTSAAGIYGVIRRGVQAINLSFGNTLANLSCGGSPAALQAYCDAIQFATDRDIVILAAAGNKKAALQFPASDSRTFSVGGYQSNGATWDQTVALGTDSPQILGADETGTNFGSNQLLVAPARDILSSMWGNSQWNNRCGSVTTFNTSLPYLQFNGAVTKSVYAAASGNLYGICTGTSMAAPHITGLVGLMRSTNPLLTKAQIRSAIVSAADGVFISNTWGYGLPNANSAVLNVLPTDRLTPLFALSKVAGDDYVYTVFPQMGAALNDGLVPPFVGTTVSTGGYYSFSWIGNTVAQFPSTFAGVTISVKPGQLPAAANYVPRARLRVFTTPQTASGVTLWPICRFSYVAGSTTRHIIDTAPKCAQSTLPSIAILDGQEGYVFPPNQAQPSGTVPVIRMEKIPAAGVPTVFVFTAQTDQAYYTGQGFSNPVVLGYAYLN